MGVEFLVCRNCEETFCDCGDFVFCESCGAWWCSEDCANDDGYTKGKCGLGKYTDDGYPGEECEFAVDGRCDKYEKECKYWIAQSCNFCRGEDYDDCDLLLKALDLLGMTREELIKKMK